MAAAALAPELLVQLEPGRFRADNLLGAEDWDAALYGCLDDRLDPAHLFPSLDPDPMFDCAFDGGGSASPPDPPWHQEPPQVCPDLQVKSEPGSPTSSHCSDSSCASEPQIWALSPPEMGVKAEPPPQEPPAPPPRGVKAEAPPQNHRTPPIQPRPPGGGAQSPPKTFLLQPLPPGTPGHLHVSGPAVLLPGGLLCLPLPPPAPPRALTPRGGGAAGGGGAAIAPGPAPATPGAPPLDVRALRRQQRMIKNRESASASRRRRKEYVQGLEQRLHLAMAENERLRRDNGALRRRLMELQGQVPSAPPVPGPRKLACLGALLLLTFHLAPLSLPQPGPAPRAPAPPPRGRRRLLEVTDLGAPPPPGIWGPSPRPGAPFRNLSLSPVSAWDAPGSPECRGFNRTESLRLADELRGWVRRHQIHRGTPGGPPPSPPRGQVQGSAPWKGPGGARLIPAVPTRPERAPPGQLQLYQGPDPPDPRILAAIDRRDDTFYVVSFRRDHLLLPARSHNKTSRPKMSLVMPAAALNDSGRGPQPMMQVDCEVMDTRVIHVRRRRATPTARDTPTGGGDRP